MAERTLGIRLRKLDPDTNVPTGLDPVTVTVGTREWKTEYTFVECDSIKDLPEGCRRAIEGVIRRHFEAMLSRALYGACGLAAPKDGT